jgi:hypothetical protein
LKPRLLEPSAHQGAPRFSGRFHCGTLKSCSTYSYSDRRRGGMGRW